MARTAYFDCFSGVSGDMFLGALIDLGLPIEDLRRALGSLAIDYGRIGADRVVRAGISATKFRVESQAEPTLPSPEPPPSRVSKTERASASQAEPRFPSPEPRAPSPGHIHHHHHHNHHSLEEIRRFIERSSLSRGGKDRAIHLFERLGRAEAEIHQTPLDKVHLHEVGALDSIIDIVGAVHGMEWLNVDDVAASPLNVGSGTVKCEHGVYPVPAPATALLLRDVPVYAGAVAAELVTPTGALLVTEYARRFGPLPAMRLQGVGYGAGDRDPKGHPNVFRVVLGESASARSIESLVVIECEIDDMNPQLFGPLMDRLFEAGAFDVFYAPVQMKKNRPGTLVTVLAPPEKRESIATVLFAETTTIGVRYQEVQRERLEREVRALETPVGVIRFKVAIRDGRILNASPEFDDCARAAAERGIPIKDVQAIATRSWLDAGARS